MKISDNLTKSYELNKVYQYTNNRCYVRNIKVYQENKYTATRSYTQMTTLVGLKNQHYVMFID